jgi:glucosamine--fructose-6-phosphate aminotransferase (isomerizing)
LSAPAGSTLLREICAQPQVLERFRELEGARARAVGVRLAAADPVGVLIAARGSSDHAAVYAKYLFGARLRVPVALAAPSLFTRYSSPPRLDRWVVLAISQSGASPDVVEVVEAAGAQGCATLGLTDREDSPLASAAHEVLSLRVGGERSVAATGSFTATLFALAHLASGWAGRDDAAALAGVPDLAVQALAGEEAASRCAESLAAAEVCAVVGRGYSFPVALEWSLKLKEIAQVFAEPFSAADYRHGPIALAGTESPVLLIDPAGPGRSDLALLARDLRALGSRVVHAADDPAAELPLPPAEEWLAPIPAAIVGQMLAHRLALARGRDPDRPPGLSKVTRTL